VALPEMLRQDGVAVHIITALPNAMKQLVTGAAMMEPIHPHVDVKMEKTCI
jgi:hypothetical protein